jgi:hypothetical protein
MHSSTRENPITGFMEMQIVHEVLEARDLVQSAPRAAFKKPYSRPTLKVHGTLAALTAHIGFLGTGGDSGTGSMSKTH